MPESNGQSSARYESLIFKDRDLFTELEEKAKKIFMLDSKGCVIFQVPRELLSIRQLVMVYLLAQTIGFERKVKDSRTLKGEDLAKLTGAPAYAIPAISTLRDHCFVEVEPVTTMPQSTDEADEEATMGNENQDEVVPASNEAQQGEENPDELEATGNDKPIKERSYNFLRWLHLMPPKPEEKEKEEEVEKPEEIYHVSLTMVNIVLDEILASVAAWERKHFYPFKWRDQMNNVL